MAPSGGMDSVASIRPPCDEALFCSPFGCQRDAIVEDEVINKGSFADTVFLCGSSVPGHQAEPVFGQGALFALLSPVLRERFELSVDAGRLRAFSPVSPSPPALGSSLRSPSPKDAPLPGRESQERQRRHEVWLADEISARGFREVARYVYRLPAKLNTLKLAEVIMAARILQMPELDQAAFQWGLANLENMIPLRGSTTPHGRSASAEGQRNMAQSPGCEAEQGPDGPIGDALCVFGALCAPVGSDGLNVESRLQAALAWRQALLRVFECEKISSNPAFMELPEDAMLLLLECQEIHGKPAHLWECCVRWAWMRKEREMPLAKAPPLCAGPSFEVPAKKLFVPGARLVAVSAPKPQEHEVDWQRWLLPIAERTRFKDMPPGLFAAHMEAINPMLPELRQVIYRVRRQGIRLDLAGSPASPLQSLLPESESPAFMAQPS